MYDRSAVPEFFAVGVRRLLSLVGVARGVTMLASDDDQVIVVRFWSEEETTDLQPLQHWRARITHVNTGQQFYAPSINDAFTVISSLVLAGKYQN